MTDAPRLDRLLASRPGRDAWEEVCELLERCDEPRLAAVSAAVLRWPAAQRPMPDRWWAQWTRGDVRPYHALAGTRGLGGLDSVETGTVPRPVEEDWADWADQADLADLAALSGLLGPLRPAPPATEPGADGFGTDGFVVPGPAGGGPGDDLPPPGVLPGADGLFPLHRGAEPRLFGGPLDGSGVPGLDTPYAWGDPGPPGLGAPPGLGVPRFPDDPDDPDDARAADDVLGLPPEAGLAAGGGHETTAGLDQGAAAVAAPASLRWLAVAGRATSAARGGDLVRWETTRDAPLVWYLNGAETTDEPTEIQVSPDGEVVVTAVEGRWAAWSAATGRQLWLLGPEENGTAAGGRGSDSLDDPVRLAFSGDGRRLAFGTTGSDVVAVVDSRTGEPLLSVEPGADAFGPVALDAHGRLLAHVAHGGRVVLRDVATGEVVAAGESGLTSVAALALAPDGHAVFAVGGAVGGGPGDAGLTVRARPAARLLSRAGEPGRHHAGGTPGGALLPGPLVRPAGCPAGMDADSRFAAVTTRACWTGTLPYAFMAADFGSVLFDGAGRTLWADPAAATAAFTPDGTALVVVQDEVTVWFLAGLRRPGLTPAPRTPHARGHALFTRLPLPETPAERPCSYWPVRLAAVTDEARAVVFSTQLDRGTARRRQVVWQRPEEDAAPAALLLPPGPGPAAALSALAFDPAGRVIARAVLSDEARLLLDGLDGLPRWRYALPAGGRRGPQRLHTAFSGDGARVALAAADGRSVVLDTASGRPVGAFREPGPTLQAVALDRTGTHVAHGMAGEGRGRVVVRRVDDGTVLLESGPRELRQFTDLAFSPHGDTLAAAGATHRRDAALWTLPRSGPEPAPSPRVAVHDLPLSDQPRGSLLWAADGPRAVFPGSRGAGVVWDATTGRVLADIPFGAGEGAVALSPDGRTLVTVTQAGARRWPL